MKKLLLLVSASTALMLFASVAVLAQGLGTPGSSGQYEPAPKARYEPVPESHDQASLPVQYSDDLLEDAADAYQYDPAPGCADEACEHTQSSARDGVSDAAKDASASSEDLPRALDAAASDAEGEGGPASASELAEDRADRAPGSTQETASTRGPGGEGKPEPGVRAAQGGRGDAGSEGAVVLDELPATGAPSEPVVLRLGGALLLTIGGLLVRSIIR